jgi:hypothetical protein
MHEPRGVFINIEKNKEQTLILSTQIQKTTMLRIQNNVT